MSSCGMFDYDNLLYINPVDKGYICVKLTEDVYKNILDLYNKYNNSFSNYTGSKQNKKNILSSFQAFINKIINEVPYEEYSSDLYKLKQTIKKMIDELLLNGYLSTEGRDFFETYIKSTSYLYKASIGEGIQLQIKLPKNYTTVLEYDNYYKKYLKYKTKYSKFKSNLNKMQPR
jgi:hypothetical protein